MEASIEPNPVAGGDDTVRRHGAENGRAQHLPLLSVVQRVDLSRKHGQDQSQNRDQVHLPPELRGKKQTGNAICLDKFSLIVSIHSARI